MNHSCPGCIARGFSRYVSAVFSFVRVQLVAKLRELALIRYLECRERGAGPEQIAVEADLSGRPCKLRMQVSSSYVTPPLVRSYCISHSVEE